MTRTRRWVTVVGALGVLLALAVFSAAVAVWLWIPDDQQLVSDAELELTTALGVKVSVASVQWRLLPTPAIVLAGVATEQTPPITIEKLSLHPKLSALYRRSLTIDLAELDGAVVPQLSLRALGRGPKGESLSGGLGLAATPLARFVFRDVTWVSRHGSAVMYEGEVDFDERWRPRSALLSRPGYKPETDARLTRLGDQNEWRLDMQLGGGTANGTVQLKTADNGQLRLNGKLKLQAVEVATALGAFNRRSVLAGKAAGDTTLAASGSSFADLARSLQTRTTFAMTGASLPRFDLGKAVRTAGKDHTGQTALDSVIGVMNTQNTPQGMVVTFKNIKARSGALSATGDATLAHRHFEAELAVDLVDGVVGFPLTLSGPTHAVVVGVPAGAVAGAVVGTAVLPVVGTAIGARLGAAIGKLFGTSPTPSASAARKARP